MIPTYYTFHYYIKRQPKREPKGYIIWAVIGLMAFVVFDSLLDCLSMHTAEDLLNNFSKSHPNLTIIPKNKQKFYSLKYNYQKIKN
jgi:hypothetical protein